MFAETSVKWNSYNLIQAPQSEYVLISPQLHELQMISILPTEQRAICLAPPLMGNPENCCWITISASCTGAVAPKSQNPFAAALWLQHGGESVLAAVLGRDVPEPSTIMHSVSSNGRPAAGGLLSMVMRLFYAAGAALAGAEKGPS